MRFRYFILFLGGCETVREKLKSEEDELCLQCLPLSEKIDYLSQPLPRLVLFSVINWAYHSKLLIVTWNDPYRVWTRLRCADFYSAALYLSSVHGVCGKSAVVRVHEATADWTAPSERVRVRTEQGSIYLEGLFGQREKERDAETERIQASAGFTMPFCGQYLFTMGIIESDMVQYT